MTISYQFGDVDAHGATIRTQAMTVPAKHRAIIGEVLGTGNLWGGICWGSCRQFTADPGRNVWVIYQQANATAKRGPSTTTAPVGQRPHHKPWVTTHTTTQRKKPTSKEFQ
jgi:hypothetical protein